MCAQAGAQHTLTALPFLSQAMDMDQAEKSESAQFCRSNVHDSVSTALPAAAPSVLHYALQSLSGR